jgi:hypothetical protein
MLGSFILVFRNLGVSPEARVTILICMGIVTASNEDDCRRVDFTQDIE